jgi:hypothetical protein
MKNLKPLEQVAYQEGFYNAKKRYKNDFQYGLFTGMFFSFLLVLFCLTFNFYN